jgi:hypothetical protein
LVREIYDVTLRFRPGEMPGRKGLNKKLGLMEGLQTIGGFFEPQWIAAVAPNARLDLFTEQAAYGPRIAAQMPRVVAALLADHETRRAAVVLPTMDEAGLSTLPCTTAIQFSNRRGNLHATFTMRSSDAVWGLPYDIVQFGLLVQAVANVLKCDAVGARINIGNAHVYDGTQHLEPDDHGGGFKISELFPNWNAARDWAGMQAERMAAGLPVVGLVTYA